MAALQAFGLIEDSGSGDSRKIKVSELGARILADHRPGVREQLLAEAAIKPALIAEYSRRWSGGRPDEPHALSQLQFEGGFTPDAAKVFLRVFDETIGFTSAHSDEKLDDYERGDDAVEGEAQAGSGAGDRPDPADVRPKRREVNTGMKEDVFSLPEGNVTLQWPAALSGDSYQDLEDWTKLMLRKIKRGIESAEAIGGVA